MGFGGLYTSISGLHASRHSLNTVSHNITNANNPNYVRQSAIHTNASYRQIGNSGFEIGTGVKIAEIRQIRDEFLDKQIRRELPSLGYFHGKAETLEDIEAVFNKITNSGLQKIMGDFWNGWEELAKEPESLTNRAMVHESAVAFTETVNHISNQLGDIQGNLNKKIISKVNEVNNLIDGIAKINKHIKVAEGDRVKIKSNDLRDERNAMIDQLSGILPVDVYENSYGEAIVSLQGQEIVSGNFVSKIQVRPDKDDNTGMSFIYFANTGEKVKKEEKGELFGIMDVRDSSVKEYKDRLDTLVSTLAEAVNDVHKAGIGLGQDNPTGIDFFTGSGDTFTAANIKVNPALSDLNKIAASASGAIGDGEVAKEIQEIRNSLKIEKYDDKTKDLSIDDFYNDLVTSLALEREEARSMENNQGFLIKSMDEKRQGLSSVSLDEEMADMIRFQHAYSANSRVINTLDEMIDTIVNRLGVVGR